MAKHNKTYRNAMPKTPVRAADNAERKPAQKAKGKPLLVPVTLVMFVLVWGWAAFWYGDVFRIAREYSFWAPDETLMYYLEGRPWAGLCWIGQLLLQTYRWPMLGALLTALFVSGSTWLVGYCLRLRGWWRLLQYLPAAIYLVLLTYIGFDLYFETETGMIMGIPFACFVVLLVLAGIIRSFSSHPFPNIVRPPVDETPRQNRVQLLLVVLIMLATVSVSQTIRPYVRVVTHMQCQMMEQDWKGMAQTARDHADLSYRQIAAYYAIALVQTGEQCNRLFDIRLDYDDPYLHGFDGKGNNAANYYLFDCDFHAGLIQTAIHHAMEQMTMNGPNIRALKMLTKCALLREEWIVADKYLHILQRVPFEGDWVNKYRPMLYNKERVDADPEFKMVRLTEPVRDNFENFFVQPTFLGYNAALTEGLSINALWNSLAVHIYTKTMPQFLERCQPLQGTTPPLNVSDAIVLMAAKYPDLTKSFPNMDYSRTRLVSFMQDVKPYMGDRAKYARELFSKYKGYYPYYYFFGNLKATRKHKENEGSSKQGVN